MLDDLKKEVRQANLALVADKLVSGTFGNVSAIDRESGHVVIKPSGMAYDIMKPRDMVVVSLDTGQVVEGGLRPSTDTPTHLALYRAFEAIGGIAHTHSTYATAWAQGRRDIPVLGTTHADYFHGPVPCTRAMTSQEIGKDYEANIGKVIAERFVQIDAMAVPGVLVANHGPFTWGRSSGEAAGTAAQLEHLAMLAAWTVNIEPYPKPVGRALLDRHYSRKHGPAAYYGQDSR